MSSYNNIPQIKIGNGKGRHLEGSLILGGMGVGVTQSVITSAVSDEGGIPMIASVGLGVLNGHFEEEKRKDRNRLTNATDREVRKAILGELYTRANQYALRDQIRKARSLTNGILGVNIMHALSDYSGLVQTAVEENIDIIISGAGIPRDLPSYLNGKDIKLVPIVSSGRLVKMICKAWGNLGHLPDAIVIEGPKAGGHLGYSREDLDNPEFVANGLEGIVREVVEILNPSNGEKPYGNIPVIAAGGIFYGGDIKKFNELGAAGVQMATRFVTTYECDADIKFKQAYLDCKPEDLRIINSPVGMPGRAITNPFLRAAEAGEKTPIHCPYHCLKTCKPEESPYCIARALVEAQQGKFTNGYVFAGANAWRCNEIVSVREVFESLNQEYAENKKSD
ncbi:MAG: nitronate monooxygenase family protein [Candidatus Pacearchaeota archaeon]|jgi:nitronate monooxygenase